MQDTTNVFLDLFERLGLRVNPNKSTLELTQMTEFIRARLDMVLARACIPDDCFLIIDGLIQQIWMICWVIWLQVLM